jgi:DNA-directed RNA polymerase subunit RPC12/RpoP
MGVVLDTYGSVRDLSNAGIVLREGLELIAYDGSDDEEDLEIHGTARYDRKRQWWVVESDERGVVYVPAAHRKPADSEFHCVACRQIVPDMNYDRLYSACPGCGVSLLTPIAPPTL